VNLHHQEWTYGQVLTIPSPGERSLMALWVHESRLYYPMLIVSSKVWMCTKRKGMLRKLKPGEEVEAQERRYIRGGPLLGWKNTYSRSREERVRTYSYGRDFGA
jgi:hypothetical protein